MTSQPAIGIDLGTTYSCVALYRNGKVEIIPNSSGGRTMPSCVSFNEIERLMGEPAKNQAAINPTNTIYDCKRLIGRKFNEATVQSDMKYWPFKIIDVEGHIKVQVTYRDEVMVFYPEEISSMLLMQLKKDTEAYLGEPIKDCVITVPAHFSDSQRQATKDAALLANLNVLRVINEPTAAALAYGMDKKNSRDGYVLVYDLGGGTFDVSILALKNHGKTVEVKSTAGNTHLGGQDFNNRLVEFFASQIKVNHGIDIMQDKRCLQKLTIACERAKRSLSTATQTFVEIESLRDDEDYRTSISRARFEELNDDLFQETLTIVEQAIQDAGITKSEIHEVILVGGSTRIPRIQTLLRNYFDRIPINCFLNPDEAVAYGAAVEAASFQNNLADEFKELVLVDVTPLSLGIKILGNQMSVIIKKNTAIPCMKSLTYSTAYNDQTTVAVSVYEGERVTATDNILLGRFELDGITKANAGSARIKILFEIDHNGILNVTARDDTTHNEKSIKISNTSRLSPEEAERMISDAERFRAIDEQRLEYYAARHALEQYSFNAKHTLEAHKYTADDDIKASIPVILENVKGTLKWIEEDDTDNAPEYKEALEGLKKMCDPIIQQLKK